MRHVIIWITCGLLLLAGRGPLSAQMHFLAGEAGSLIEDVLVVNGLERSYLAYVPSTYDGAQPVPLLLVFHGFGSSPENIMTMANFNPLAQEEQFIVLYPRASEQPTTWYNGTGVFRPFDDDRDLQFVDALLAVAKTQWRIDERRIYAVGFSMGGGMAYRIACERSGQFAAFGTVAGAFATIPDGCTPERPVPVMAIHGLADRVVPFEGTRWLLPSVSDWVMEWAQRNQCEQPSLLPPFTEGIRFRACAEDATVVLITVPEAGHTWPGTPHPNRASRLGGRDDGHVNATQLLWDFLKGYALPIPMR